MGDELSVDPDFVPAPLNIPGVTDTNGHCDAVLFTHYHGDHIGQMARIRPEIPLYAGALAKDIILLSAQHSNRTDEPLFQRMESIRTFSPGEAFSVGDIRITPYSIDHSACDSYMFLLEADGKRVLYTGDFRPPLYAAMAVAQSPYLEYRPLSMRAAASVALSRL